MARLTRQSQIVVLAPFEARGSERIRPPGKELNLMSKRLLNVPSVDEYQQDVSIGSHDDHLKHDAPDLTRLVNAKSQHV